MLPTIVLSVLIAAAFVAIVGKGIYNRKHHKGGCSGCGGSCAGCHGCGVIVTSTPSGQTNQPNT